jgi:hypothetical protein
MFYSMLKHVLKFFAVIDFNGMQKICIQNRFSFIDISMFRYNKLEILKKLISRFYCKVC